MANGSANAGEGIPTQKGGPMIQPGRMKAKPGFRLDLTPTFAPALASRPAGHQPGGVIMFDALGDYPRYSQRSPVISTKPLAPGATVKRNSPPLTTMECCNGSLPVAWLSLPPMAVK